MQLAWSEFSLTDREDIMDYISQDNPAAAIALDDAFEAAAHRACRQPYMYKLGRLPDTREIVVHPHYVMVYQVQNEALVILRVLHTAMLWP